VLGLRGLNRRIPLSETAKEISFLENLKCFQGEHKRFQQGVPSKLKNVTKLTETGSKTLGLPAPDLDLWFSIPKSHTYI
jgi:hypothetical protein